MSVTTDNKLDTLIYLLREQLTEATNETRLEIFKEIQKGFCTLCGTEHLPCYCSPHYDN